MPLARIAICRLTAFCKWRTCGVVYSAVGSSLLAYSLWYGLLKKLLVNKVMPYSLCPVGAIALGCLVMHEALTPDKVIGAAVVIMGVVLSSVTRPLRATTLLKFRSVITSTEGTTEHIRIDSRLAP